MWFDRRKVLPFITIPLICLLFRNAFSLEFPKIRNIRFGVLHPLESAKSLTEKIISNPLDTAKSVAEKVISNPLEYLNDIPESIVDPVDLAKNLSDVVATTAVFITNNKTLNCLGLPIKLFANAVEKMFTQTTKANDVRFYFSSRNHPEYAAFKLGNFSLEGADFHVARPTILISHGFMASGRERWIKDMKDALLRLDDVNVIVVDWQEGSNTWNYYSAAISTRIVGLQIAKLFALIRDLVPRSGNAVPDIEQWGTVYFIGHSLGAHISGHAAFLMKKSQENNDKIWAVSRITGLDPASPCFNEVDMTLRLDKDDASFVDVIHTNAKHMLLLGLGLPEQLGFVDFYPNGGEVQPGCADIDTTIWDFILLPKNIIQETICSHGRSHDFLTESLINIASGNCSFIGFAWNRKTKEVSLSLDEKCGSGLCTEMGVNSVAYYPNNNGTFFVPTRETFPFCQNGKQVFKIQSSQNVLSRVAKKLLNL